MKKIAFIAGLACCSLFVGKAQAQQQQYGAPFELQDMMAPGRLDVMMADKDKMEDVQMTGLITEVCQKEGCWMKITTAPNAADELFVKMKDHAFLLPKDIAGRYAVIFGNVSKEVVSVAEQRHYLEDAGASAEEIAKITAPKESYQMEARGVILLDK